ncbi:hypothetical protein I302_106245 [Kwoniella bestiolae CBS 10118]|uniref:Uncharacterized protein n=1 Tax=Kwoniella bestiolae CBS 10118 TaxID=1296100 RepID=A0A1B9G3E0_9TREE|nr:hypothetical protein I302_05369 [Kwoniella bestiolae CBS 10118]OCF25549.1 hypothetical protein I302_05369 [Kwoniella bestiolae CBS 10118]
MPSPKIERFTLLLEQDGLEFSPHPDDISSPRGNTDGFEEIVSANMAHFAKIENAIETVSGMWKGCYKYIASRLRPEYVKVNPVSS